MKSSPLQFHLSFPILVHIKGSSHFSLHWLRPYTSLPIFHLPFHLSALFPIFAGKLTFTSLDLNQLPSFAAHPVSPTQAELVTAFSMPQAIIPTSD